MKTHSFISSLILGGLILSATSVVAAPSKSKCTQSILHAVRDPGNYDSDVVFAEKNGEIVVTGATPNSKLVKDENKLQVERAFGTNAVMGTKSSYKDKIVFERENGQYKKVTVVGEHATYVSTLNADCELDQIVVDDKAVEFDRALCDGIAEKMAGGVFEESFSMESLEKCGRLGRSIAKVMNDRDFEIRKVSNQKRSIPEASHSFGAPAFSAIYDCARELNYAKKQNGIFTKARELSTQWFKDAFHSASAKANAAQKGAGAIR